MKVLSLLQPWANLCVMTDSKTGKAYKQIETRSWNTKYRGELLIHASAGKKADQRSIMLDFQQQFFDVFYRQPLRVVRGVIIQLGEFFLPLAEILRIVQITVISRHTVIVSHVFGLRHFFSRNQRFVKFFTMPRTDDPNRRVFVRNKLEVAPDPL